MRSGGLARAVRAEQAEALAALHLQVEAAHRVHVAVAFVQPGDPDGSVHRRHHNVIGLHCAQ